MVEHLLIAYGNYGFLKTQRNRLLKVGNFRAFVEFIFAGWLGGLAKNSHINYEQYPLILRLRGATHMLSGFGPCGSREFS